jgi:hypothetical protein
MSSKKLNKSDIIELIELIKKLHTTLPAHEKIVDDIGTSIDTLQGSANMEIMNHITNIKQQYKKGQINTLKIQHILFDLEHILILLNK